MHYACIACITTDSVVGIDQKKSSADLFRRMQIQNKKMQMSRFMNTELKSDSDSELESDTEAEPKSDTKLMAKLKSDSDSE